MKKSFDINITSYQAKTVITIIKPDEIALLNGEDIPEISFQTRDDEIEVWIGSYQLNCSNAWEWNKVKELILTVMPDQKALAWHKKKFKAHPCYQDYSKP